MEEAGEWRLRRRLRSSLAGWAAFALAPQGQVPARHHRLLLKELAAVSAGRVDRLMLLLPPGHAKSTYASLVFPPWFLARHKRAQVVAVSHTQSLARHFGLGVRGLIAAHGARLGIALDPGSRAAQRFGLAEGGGYFATGVRGALAGRRADLLLVDDPVRNQADAERRESREAVWDWWRSDAVTRLKPGGRAVVVMTRWHPDDLGGRLLASADTWRVVRLPALAEPGDPLGRAEGAALWPEWEGREALLRKQAILGERAFAALFQQVPRVAEGGLFRTGRIVMAQQVEAGGVRAWDLAASSGSGADWTVGLRLVRRADGGFLVADVVRARAEPAAVEALVRRTAERDGPGVVIGLPQDPGQAGRAQVGWLTRAVAGHRVVATPETGSKALRAQPVAAQVNAGNLSVLDAAWAPALLEEMADFPGGAKDDQVDALSRAFGLLVEQGRGARVVVGGVMGR
jgi:predicted phage terminase large subunit-like protein